MDKTQGELLDALGVKSIRDLSFVQRILVERTVSTYKLINYCESQLDDAPQTHADILRDDIRAAENQLMKHLKHLGLLTEKPPKKTSLMDHFKNKNAIQKSETGKRIKKATHQESNGRN